MERLKKITDWLLLLVLTMIFVVGAAFVTLTILPMSYWIYYESVEPAKDFFSVDESLQFVSTLEVKRPSTVSWNDIVYCIDPDLKTYCYYMEYTSSNANVETHGIDHVVWNYPKSVGIATECYLKSTTNLHLPFNIVKQQTTKSGKFKIVKPD